MGCSRSKGPRARRSLDQGLVDRRQRQPHLHSASNLEVAVGTVLGQAVDIPLVAAVDSLEVAAGDSRVAAAVGNLEEATEGSPMVDMAAAQDSLQTH